MVGCKFYIAKTFLHLAGGLGLTTAMSQIPAAEYVINSASNKALAKIGLFIFYLVAAFALLFGMRFAPVGGPLQYSLAIAFIFIISQTFKPVLEELNKKNVLARTFFLTTGVFAGMAILGFYDKGNLMGFAPYLLAGLVGLLLARIILAVLDATDAVSQKEAAKGSQVLSMFGVALFSVFVAFDTQSIKFKARTCKGKGDYVNDSLDLFLDFINLFTNVGDLLGGD